MYDIYYIAIVIRNLVDFMIIIISSSKKLFRTTAVAEKSSTISIGLKKNKIKNLSLLIRTRVVHRIFAKNLYKMEPTFVLILFKWYTLLLLYYTSAVYQ